MTDRPSSSASFAGSTTEPGSPAPTRLILRKVFPDHWSFLLGEVALFCFVILVATGTFLTFFYVPDARPVDLRPARSCRSRARRSRPPSIRSCALSFEVRAGLLMRQTHHWTALFSWARRPPLSRACSSRAPSVGRARSTGSSGSRSLVLALLEGLHRLFAAGRPAVRDRRFGSSTRRSSRSRSSGRGQRRSLFGGEFPTADLISRFFVIHVMLAAGRAHRGVIALHIGFVFAPEAHAVAGRAVPARTTSSGLPFWPAQTFRSLGLFFLTAAVVVLIGGALPDQPVWVYGPFLPYGRQPRRPSPTGTSAGSRAPSESGLPIEPIDLRRHDPHAVPPGHRPARRRLHRRSLLWPFIEARLTATITANTTCSTGCGRTPTGRPPGPRS